MAGFDPVGGYPVASIGAAALPGVNYSPGVGTISFEGLVFDAAETRISQAGAQLLVSHVTAETRISQAGAQALAAGVTLDLRVSQAGALVLADAVACITRWCQCWKITRADGVVLAFTSLDRAIVFDGVSYQPCDSLSASASEMFSTPGQAGNLELQGIISDDAITEEALFGGVYDNAAIEVWLVPWDASNGDTPFRLAAGVAGNLSQGDLGFTMEVLTPGARLAQQALVQVYAPSCRFELGDSRCTKSLGALTVTGTVDSVGALDAGTQSTRRAFYDAARVEAAGYFDNGVITWTTGQNAGAKSEVKRFSGGNFTLWSPMLYPIAAGDQYSLVPGCDKLAATCKTKFSNYTNFGGYPDVPGQDDISKTPNAKN